MAFVNKKNNKNLCLCNFKGGFDHNKKKKLNFHFIFSLNLQIQFFQFKQFAFPLLFFVQMSN